VHEHACARAFMSGFRIVFAPVFGSKMRSALQYTWPR